MDNKDILIMGLVILLVVAVLFLTGVFKGTTGKYRNNEGCPDQIISMDLEWLYERLYEIEILGYESNCNYECETIVDGVDNKFIKCELK